MWANVSSEVCSRVSGSCWFVLARAERLESELEQAAASWIASFVRGIAWKICMVLLIVIGFIAGASGHGSFAAVCGGQHLAENWGTT